MFLLILHFHKWQMTRDLVGNRMKKTLLWVSVFFNSKYLKLNFHFQGKQWYFLVKKDDDSLVPIFMCSLGQLGTF